MSEEEIKSIRKSYKLASKFNRDFNTELDNKVFDYIEQLQQENKQLNEQIEKLKQQQKEFMGYLEKEIADSKAGSSQYYSAIEHLKLYSKIIDGERGGKNE